MGLYINKNSKGEILPNLGKVQALINDGAVITDERFKENLVCVVEQGLFDAAAYMYSENEHEEFIYTVRTRTWLVYDKAKELAK